MDAEAGRTSDSRKKRISAQLWQRVNTYILSNEDSDEDREETYPDMAINNLDLSWPVWLVWRATGRRFLPSQLLAEPQWLLDDVLALDAAYVIADDEIKRQRPGPMPSTPGNEIAEEP